MGVLRFALCVTIVGACGHTVNDACGSNATVGSGSQLSVAVTVAGAGIESHSTVASAGQPISVGGVSSTTVMV